MTETRHPVRRQLIGLAVVVIIVGVSVGALLGAIGPDMFNSSGQTVRAVFANTQQLKKGDEVRISGLQLGTVTQIQLNPGGRSSTVAMALDPGAGPIYADASALLQWKTLLGSAFYVDLNRGTPGGGLLGGRAIQEGHTGNQVELEDVLSVDQGAARHGLTTLLPQLSTGFSDPAPLGRGLSELGAVAPTVATGVGALRGESATRDYDLEGLVSHTAGVLRALNAPDSQLQGLVQGAAVTLGVTAARAADLEAALDEATPAMDQTLTTFAQLHTTLDLARPLLTYLKNAAPDVAPTFRVLRPTLNGANNLLHTAVPLLRSLPSAAGSLANASQQGLPLLQELTPDLDTAAQVIFPYLNAQDPQTQHTTAEMIGPTLEALGPDIAGQMDQNGHFIRFPASSGNSPLYINCQTYVANPSASQLLACETVQQSLNELLTSNPVGSATQSDGSGASADRRGRAAAPSGRTSAAGGSSSAASTPNATSTTSAAGSAVSATVGGIRSLSSAVGSVLSNVSGSLTDPTPKLP